MIYISPIRLRNGMLARMPRMLTSMKMREGLAAWAYTMTSSPSQAAQSCIAKVFWQRNVQAEVDVRMTKPMIHGLMPAGPPAG